jgi:hypothetical protein
VDFGLFAERHQDERTVQAILVKGTKLVSD